MNDTMDRTGSAAPSRGLAATGAILAALGVALGAFGTHALGPVLNDARMATFETAVRYQTHQAIGLLVLAVLPRPTRAAASLLLAGTLIFSGSLYLLVATDASWLGAVAPIGGAGMIAGWALVAWKLLRV